MKLRITFCFHDRSKSLTDELAKIKLDGFEFEYVTQTANFTYARFIKEHGDQWVSKSMIEIALDIAGFAPHSEYIIECVK